MLTLSGLSAFLKIYTLKATDSKELFNSVEFLTVEITGFECYKLCYERGKN